MRISKEAAAANKDRVRTAASRVLRERGFDGLGIAEVMKEAGLAHGGFYNHFGSKEDLATEALRAAFDSAVARITKAASDADSPRARAKTFEDYVGRYLSKKTRDTPGSSCPMATLAIDAARHGDTLKAECADGLERYLEAFARVVPDAGSRRDNRQDAIIVMSTLISALVLARASAGVEEELSEDILPVVRARLLESSNP